MKILVLGGSPNRDGSTQLLIDSFSRGAREAGHRVTVLDTAHMTKRSRYPQAAYELGKKLR